MPSAGFDRECVIKTSDKLGQGPLCPSIDRSGSQGHCAAAALSISDGEAAVKEIVREMKLMNTPHSSPACREAERACTSCCLMYNQGWAGW